MKTFQILDKTKTFKNVSDLKLFLNSLVLLGQTGWETLTLINTPNFSENNTKHEYWYHEVCSDMFSTFICSIICKQATVTIHLFFPPCKLRPQNKSNSDLFLQPCQLLPQNNLTSDVFYNPVKHWFIIKPQV